MKFISLFSGIGGFDIGLERAGMECVGQVEIDPKCQLVLAKHWPNVKRIGDIRNVTGDEFGAVRLICGSPPCQPFSVAGKQRGSADNRHLWPQMFRVIQLYKPTWVIAENVRGLIGVENGMVFESLLSDLETEKYEVQPFLIPACGADAFHRRERVWVVGYSKYYGQSTSETGGGLQFQSEEPYGTVTVGESSRASSASVNVADSNGSRQSWSCGGVSAISNSSFGNDFSNSSKNVADTYEQRLERQIATRLNPRESGLLTERCRWLPEPGLDRVVNGISNRTHRLKQLGNAVVPQIVEKIGRAIMATEKIYSQEK